MDAAQEPRLPKTSKTKSTGLYGCAAKATLIYCVMDAGKIGKTRSKETILGKASRHAKFYESDADIKT